MRQVGVPTLLNHMRLSSAVGELRQQAEKSRTEVVTGRKSDIPRALGAGMFDAQLLRSAIDGAGLHREAISRLAIRAEIAQRALSEVSSGAAQLNAELLAALGRGDEAAVAVSSTESRARIETAFSRLNVRVEGLSLFAGDAADQNALTSADQLLLDVSSIYTGAASSSQLEADLDFYFNDPAGGFATSIYTGGAGALGSFEISDGEHASATAKANEPAIKDLLRGLAVIAVAGSAPPSTYRDASLASAGSHVLNGADGIVEISTRIGIDEKRANDAGVRLDEEEPALAAAYNALTAVDPYEAASRLQAIESQVEASYVLTSRLARLSLANFI